MANLTMQPEPKVNIYRDGGFFKPHVDGMQLTLLAILNDGYEGGGTAFFASPTDDDDHDEGGARDDGDGPSRLYAAVARPSAGTAMIWGGDLLHTALPVTEGMRAVYVGSFDLGP